MVQFPAASSWTRECRLTYLLTVRLTLGIPLTLPHTKKHATQQQQKKVFVMGLAKIVLGTRYSKVHVAGAALCILGMAGIIVVDARTAAKNNGTKNDTASLVDSIEGSNQALGDFLVLVAALLYACSNVGEEYSVKRRGDNVDFLGMIGLFGVVVSGVQMVVLERRAIEATDWSKCAWLVVGYTLCLFTMYSLVPLLIRSSSATVFNLSLLTADVYTFIYGNLVFKINFEWL